MKEKITQYIYSKYKTYKDLPLTIEEYDSHFSVKLHEDQSPLILGKSVV